MRVSAYAGKDADMHAPDLEELNRLHADLCSAVADPTRILLIYALHEQPRTVNDLAGVIGASQSATSRHLRTLRTRGLVRATRLGPSVEYRLADHRLIEALDLLRQILRDTVSRRAELLDETLSAA
jgi:DNA-binding transcriptional ArsR family regulator